MKKYIAKRLLQLVVVVLGLSFLTFALMYIAPGDPAEKKLSAQGIAVDPEVLAATRAEMGLDRPFLEQYADWLGGLFSGDLGESYRSGRAVVDMLGESFVYTLELTVLSLAAALQYRCRWRCLRRCGKTALRTFSCAFSASSAIRCRIFSSPFC